MKAHLLFNVRYILGLSLCLAATPAWCEQWAFNLTPTSVQVENVNNSPLLYFTVSQSVVNPAHCLAVDGYTIADSVIVNQAYAAVLTAITSQQTISVYVSGSVCAVNGRPVAIFVQIP